MSVDERGLTLTDGYTHSFKTAIDCLTKEAEAMDAENRVGRASMLRSIVEELQDAQQRRATTSPAGDPEPVAWRADHMVEGEYTRKFTAIRRVAEIWAEQGLNVTPLYAQALRYQSTGVTEITDDMVEAFLATPIPNRFASMRGVVTRGFLEADSSTPLDEAHAHVRHALTAALSAQEDGK